MKKNYFLSVILLILTLSSFGQSVVITGYVDSVCSNSDGRVIEMYVDGTIDFTDWTLVRQSNGNGFTGIISISDLGIVSNTFVYVTNSLDTLSSEFGITTNVIQNGGINSNGDDAFQIMDEQSIVIDRFGEENVDGSGTDWEHVDTYYYRKDGVPANGGSFSVNNWNIGVLNSLSGEGLCNSANSLGTLVPFGSYTTVASTNPEIFLTGNVNSLDYYEGNGPSAEDSFTVSGSNLTDDITIMAPTNFEISLTSSIGFVNSLTLNNVNGGVGATTVYIRLVSDLGINEYSGEVILSSNGATNDTLSVAGVVEGADPQITVFAFLDDLNYVFSEGGPSNEDSFTISGLFLTSDVVIDAPTNFEISLSSGSNFTNSISLSPVSGSLDFTTIYVRMSSGLSAGNYMEDIMISSTDITSEVISLNGNVYGDPTNSLIITGVYDGPLTGGTPKGIELYVLKDIEDLSLFGISSVTNGAGSSNGNVEYNFPSDSVLAGTFIYLTTEGENFNVFFGIDADYIDNVVSINGDDSIELYENGQIIDTFGDVNMDGSGEAWDYLDGWAYRNSDTEPEGTNFTVDNWSYSLIDAFDNESLNETAATPFPIGTYSLSSASITENQIEGLGIYPNPATDNLTISTANTTEKTVTIYNTLGKEVLAAKVSGTKANLSLSNISSGLYIVKVLEEGSLATSSLIIE